MSKKQIEKMQKEYTKPQLSRWQQQKKRQRIIMFSGIALIAVVIIGLFTAWFMEEQWPYYKTVINVNGEKITMRQYVNTLKAMSEGQDENLIYNYAMQVDSLMAQTEILKQAAADVNITVTNEEVNTKLKEYNLTEGWATYIRMQLLSGKMLEEYFIPQVPATVEQRDIEVMFLESDAQVNAIRALLDEGQSFADLAAQYSLDDYSKNQKGAIGMHPKEIFINLLGSNVPGEYAFSSDTGSLSQGRPDADKEKAVGYWLIMLIETGTGEYEGQANVRAMLLGSEAEANQVRKDIVENGQDFGTIADEKSQYSSGGKNGGLIGFVSEDSEIFSAAFKNAAFSLEIGEISQPVKDITMTTKGGSWLIKVVGADSDAAISDEDKNTIANALFELWFLSAQANAVVVDSISATDVINGNEGAPIFWAISKVIGD
ncbi:MAG: peptidylprolyl isomerase [Dehalococcoidales bacterium]|nr:peptidylprolyl isomerase [Dehalococcoidales bacterium]